MKTGLPLICSYSNDCLSSKNSTVRPCVTIPEESFNILYKVYSFQPEKISNSKNWKIQEILVRFLNSLALVLEFFRSKGMSI